MVDTLHVLGARSQTETETTVSKQKHGNTGSHPHSDRSSALIAHLQRVSHRSADLPQQSLVDAQQTAVINRRQSAAAAPVPIHGHRE